MGLSVLVRRYLDRGAGRLRFAAEAASGHSKIDQPGTDNRRRNQRPYLPVCDLVAGIADTYGHGAARWVNVLKFQNYGTNDTLACTLPSSFTGDISRRMRMGHATLVSREGFVLPQEYKNHSEYMRLFNGRDAIIEWLKSQGVEAKVSDPGRIADQILHPSTGSGECR